MKEDQPTPESCQCCGAPIDIPPLESVPPAFRLPVTLCSRCDEAEQLALHKAELKEKREAAMRRFKDRTPERYFETNIERPDFNAHLWKDVSVWEPSSQTPWLGLVGPSGRSKSRCAVLRAGRYTQQGVAPVFVPGREFERWAKFLFSENGEKFRINVERALRTQILIFDDIGKIKPTPAVVGALFDLLEHRHSHNMTTFWTANEMPKDMTRCYDKEFAVPIAGRLMESSKIFLLPEEKAA